MKKFSIFIATIMMVTAMEAAEKLDLKSITSGEFSASYVTGINPIEGTDLYASISNDGKQIVSYSFKSGKQVAVLFDIHETQAPFESIDGYVMSPDGKQLLVITKSKAVYRRSFKAEYFIYNIASKKLRKLSEGENQQVATWSPDSKHIAFVKDISLSLMAKRKRRLLLTASLMKSSTEFLTGFTRRNLLSIGRLHGMLTVLPSAGSASMSRM